MDPLLAVLIRSDAFRAEWEDLAQIVGARLAVVETAEEARALAGVCALLIAAGGLEREALPLVRDLVGSDSTPLAVVGADRDHRLAIAAVRAGASDYFSLPTDLSQLHAWLKEQTERCRGAEAARSWANEQRQRFDFSTILGRSPSLVEALERAGRVIPFADTTVLLTGETGTGKDMLARAIHYNSSRGAAPFVEVNCAALPATLLEAELFGYEKGAFTDAKTEKPGLFEAAQGGTLFLDEIGDLTLELQAKLLRALENKRVRRLGSVAEREIDARIVAATHVELESAVREKRFRRDLYYRLNVAHVHLPPLRERGGDVLLLAEHFLKSFTARHGLKRQRLSRPAKERLAHYGWPGNVRELKHVIERALLFAKGEEIQAEDVRVAADAYEETPGELRVAFPASLEEVSREVARAAVEYCNGNKSEAARILDVGRKRLYALLAEE